MVRSLPLPSCPIDLPHACLPACLLASPLQYLHECFLDWGVDEEGLQVRVA